MMMIDGALTIEVTGSDEADCRARATAVADQFYGNRVFVIWLVDATTTQLETTAGQVAATTFTATYKARARE
jgi:hypothetical protein